MSTRASEPGLWVLDVEGNSCQGSETLDVPVGSKPENTPGSCLPSSAETALGHVCSRETSYSPLSSPTIPGKAPFQYSKGALAQAGSHNLVMPQRSAYGLKDLQTLGS